jgi:hypothetical protein
MDPRLSTLYKGMKRDDPPPDRVKTILVQVTHHAQPLVAAALDDTSGAAMDIGWLGFFYLLRPGEYCKCTDNSPLTVGDVCSKLRIAVLLQSERRPRSNAWTD